MLTEEEIQVLVKHKIETDEDFGVQSSGSGHLGNKTYAIDNVQTKKLENGNLEIRYQYTLFVETEFTYYPDHPPMEYPKTGLLVVQNNNVRHYP